MKVIFIPIYIERTYEDKPFISLGPSRHLYFTKGFINEDQTEITDRKGNVFEIDRVFEWRAFVWDGVESLGCSKAAV
jgi:hypothetical protein